MQTFRVFLPGYGNVYVRAFSPSEALDIARGYLIDNQITIEEPVADDPNSQPTVTPASEGSIPPDSLYLNQAGDVLSGNPVVPVDPVGSGSGSGSDRSGSSTPGENPTAPATGTSGTPSPTAVPTDLEREIADPAAAFRNFASELNLPTTGVLGARLQDAGRFTSPVKQLSELASANTGGDPRGLNSFLRNTTRGQGITRGLGASALGSLQSLRGVNPNSAGDFDNAQLQGFLAPDSFGSQDARVVQSGLRAALGSVNPFLAAQFGSQFNDELGRRFGDRVFAGNQPTNFIDFALSQYGL